ncbi:MAG: cation:proton antiporter [Comamonadaceae bacterium]|nr:cation:proton antiporter [Comamonadaceae bacterium]
MALGAFLAGLAVGRSEFAARAAGDAVPMRDAFAVLFFVSVGMLFDPRSLVQAPLADRGRAGRGGRRQAAGRHADRARSSACRWPRPSRSGPPSRRWASSASFSARSRRSLGLIDDAGWNALGGRVHHLDRPESRHLSLGAPVVAVASGAGARRRPGGPADRPEPLHPGRLRSGRQDRPPPARRARRVRHGDRPEPRHGAAAARPTASPAIYGDVLRPGTLERGRASRRPAA